VLAARTPIVDKKPGPSSSLNKDLNLEENNNNNDDDGDDDDDDLSKSGLLSPSLSLSSLHRWKECKVDEDFESSLWPALQCLGWIKVACKSAHSKNSVIYCRPGVDVKEAEAEATALAHGK
jgi:hypothetical protein